MEVATVLFTYNRPVHTSKVLTGLRNNSILPKKLFVFHDGKKTDDDAWYEVDSLINAIDWCPCEVISSSENKGLAKSVLNGINQVLDEYDAIIVLEDDCVPHRLFMEYMLNALDKYESEERVFCIGAHPERIRVPDNGTDAYFVGRICSWGWATWKSRWKYYRRDYDIIGEIIKKDDLKDWLNVWGRDLEQMLYDNMVKKVDSWAVFWALSVIYYKGLCLLPYYSLVENIGFDGTGTNCGKADIVTTMMPDDKDHIILPDAVSEEADYKRIFANYFPWISPSVRDGFYKRVLLKWLDTIKLGKLTDDWFVVNGITRISLWGLGDIGKRLIGDIKDYIKIDSIIETTPKANNEYEGIKIISPDQLIDNMECIVVIPGYDIDRIKLLVSENIGNRLVSVSRLFEVALPDWKIKCFSEYGVRLRKYGNEYGGYYLNAAILKESPIVYSFGIGEDISFDEDMMNEHNAVIYAFDPTPKSVVFLDGIDIINKPNFHFYQYGLSGKTSEVNFYLPKNDEYVSGSEIRHDNLKEQAITICMKDLYSTANEMGHSHINVLKMDIEGSEYSVIDSMNAENNLIIDQICLENHQRFFEDGMRRAERMDRKLHELGYVLIFVSEDYELMTYIRKELLIKH